MTSVPYVIFGLGGVGRGLVRAILGASEKHAAEYGVEFVPYALCDSRGAIGDCKTPLTAEVVRAVHDAKEKGEDLAAGTAIPYVARGDGVTAAAFLESVVENLIAAGHKDAIIVDCTATDATIPALLKAVAAGLKVASANKKPFAADQATFDQLTGAPFKRLSKVRHESSVGAGLPVITALTRTVAANDPISKINGTFSGTLGYVMTGLQNGESFSEVVLEAKRLGYTEPDPRDDLGGVDVARKALILARLMGWKLEMDAVRTERSPSSELAPPVARRDLRDDDYLRDDYYLRDYNLRGYYLRDDYLRDYYLRDYYLRDYYLRDDYLRDYYLRDDSILVSLS